ncbi:hypothetical protein [Faecalibacterium prausnitzii]|uniref:hypothetical protein n=1 Tax=Faecalibacterium prausnitzii TaxID=853 RepID=UPI001CBFE082|nr:hypothetical protein [Faecalibacterium prausnitzii]
MAPEMRAFLPCRDRVIPLQVFHAKPAMWGSLFWAQRPLLRPYSQRKEPAQMLKIHERIAPRKKEKIRRKPPKNQNIKRNTVKIAQKIML